MPAESELVSFGVAMENFLAWSQLQTGDLIDVSANLLVVGTTACLYRSMDMQGKLLRIEGLTDHPNSCLFLGLQVSAVSPLVLTVVSDSVVLPVPHCTAEALWRVVEFCCGLGGFSAELHRLGYQVQAGIDVNALWEPLFHAMHDQPATFIACDIGNLKQLLPQLSQLGLHFAVYLSGVNCQPFSNLGDQLGMDDSRAASLPKTLKAAWLMQAGVIALECVPQVLQNAQFQQILLKFCQLTGYRLTQQIVRLSNCWAAKRDRWFGLLTAPLLDACEVRDLPVAPAFQNVGKVLPSLHPWPATDLEQLELTLYELGKFYDFTPGGIQTAFLDAGKPLATCLHSAGNAVYPCSCGCRAGLSEQRMASKGLFCTLIPTGTTQFHAGREMLHCRYLHPREMLLLNGADPLRECGKNLRLTLAGIGQFVSPLVGLWILAHVRPVLSRFLGVECERTPEQEILDFTGFLVHQASQFWQAPQLEPCSKMPEPPHVEDTCSTLVVLGLHFVGDSQASCPVTVDGTCTVKDLLLAELGLRGLDDLLEVRDMNLKPLDSGVLLAELADVWIGPPAAFAVACALEAEATDTAMDEAVVEVAASTEDAQHSPEEAGGEPVTVATGLSDLVSRSPDDLLALACPCISTLSLLAQFKTQFVSKEVRLELLETQQNSWADDEVTYALQQVVLGTADEQNAVLCDPLVLSSAYRTGNHAAFREFVQLQGHPVVTLVSAFCHAGHWTPTVWRIEHDKVFCFVAAVSTDQDLQLQALHKVVCDIRCSEVEPIVERPVPAVPLCGAFAVAFCQHLLWGTPCAIAVDALQAFARKLREDFVVALPAVMPRPWIWGAGSKEQSLGASGQLEALLLQHGVAKEQVQSRAMMLTSQLGTSAIVKAMACAQPWKELKWHASNHAPPIQIVLPSELQQVLDRKAQQGQVGNRAQKRAKGMGKGGKGHAAVDPAVLRLEPGAFVAPTKEVLPQIQLAQIAANATGVVLASAEQALPFLTSGKTFSAGALAIVVLEPFSPGLTDKGQLVQFPAVCTSNSEPVLLKGLLFQLGSVIVSKATHHDGFCVKSVQSCVVKLLAFRDQLDIAWNDFAAHPLQHLLQVLPILVPCDNPDCANNCESWHPASQCAIADPVMEVWGRQWLLQSFASTTPDKAEIYSAHLRVPECVQMQLQAMAGHQGVYVEPKAIDGRQFSADFQVVWAPKSTYSQMQILRKTIPGVCGIARLGQRYGLRCLTSQAASVYAAMKPGQVYLPPGPKLLWYVGPFPWGTIKASVSEALHAAGWTARCLTSQPAGKDIAGLLFKVQSTVPPPKQTLSMQHGDVVITKVDEVASVVPKPATVIGAPATVSMVAAPAGGRNEDLVWKYDPWAPNGKSATTQVAQPISIADPLEDLEARVVKAVLEKMPAERMEVDGAESDARMTALEQQLDHLSQSQRQLQAVVQEQSVENTQQLQLLQTSFQQKHEQLESHIANNATQLHQEFQQQMQAQQSMLDNMFTRQMTQFESLLNKRKHNEWRCPVGLWPLVVDWVLRVKGASLTGFGGLAESVVAFLLQLVLTFCAVLAGTGGVICCSRPSMAVSAVGMPWAPNGQMAFGLCTGGHHWPCLTCVGLGSVLWCLVCSLFGFWCGAVSFAVWPQWASVTSGVLAHPCLSGSVQVRDWVLGCSSELGTLKPPKTNPRGGGGGGVRFGTSQRSCSGGFSPGIIWCVLDLG